MLLMENESALQDALAFIDAFEADAAACSSSGDADASSGESTKPPRRKKRSHTERVKTELEQLRNDAEALENTLKRLRQNAHAWPPNQLAVHWSPSTTARFDAHNSSLIVARGQKTPVTAMWMEIVVEEFRRRRESEILNGRLKAMVAKQVSMMQASEAALTPKFTDVDLDLLFESKQPKANRTDIQEKALAKSLSLRVQQLRKDLDSVLERTGLLHIDSFLSWSQRKHDGNVGVFFETTYCLPVAFNFKQTNEAFVAQTQCTAALESMKNEIDIYQLQPLEVMYQQQMYDLSAKSTVRMIQEKDRVVYLWTALVSLPSRQWTFVEDSIIIVRRANADLPTSLLQNWHRVWMEDKGSPSPSDPLKETILSSLSNRVKDHMRRFKSSMENAKPGGFHG